MDEAAGNATSSCVASHTRSVQSGACFCFGDFYGPNCGFKLDLWYRYQLSAGIMIIVLQSYLFLWALLKIIRLIKDGDFKWQRLSTPALLLGFLASAVRIAHGANLIVRWDVESADLPPYNSPVNSVFVGLATAAWISATNIILGFWFDILQNKIRPVMAARTKIVCIAIAFLDLLYIPGLMCWLVFDLKTLGVSLVTIPMVINCFAIFTILILILTLHSKSTEGLGKEYELRIRFTRRIMSFSVGAWFLQLLDTIGMLVVVAFPEGKLFKVGIVIAYVDIFIIFIIGYCLLRLIDRRGGLFRLARGILRSKDDTAGDQSSAVPTQDGGSETPYDVSMTGITSAVSHYASSQVEASSSEGIREIQEVDSDYSRSLST